MNNNTPVRVRFAPSPTGHLHIGGLRTALFNLLFARHNNGTFLLRLEDTDLERSKDEYTQAILKALAWTKIEPDESMVIQSERYPEHETVINRLIEQKKAYRCYCTPQEVAARVAADPKLDPEFAKYDGYCRSALPQDKPFVVRFALPDKPSVSFHDLIRGDITFAMDQFDDFIIARTDGRPVYNFVVVVDDAAMRISHVIRGEDHIPNTPKQILLHEACGNKIPQFAHLPLILGPSGQPLSKRDAATSVMDYHATGYLPDALVNYLVRLGWAHGDQELFTRTELFKYFSLDAVGKKGAIFDMAKLSWVNSMYLKNEDNKKLLEQILSIRPRFEAELSKWDKKQVLDLIGLYKGRAKTLIEIADEIKSLYEGTTPYAITDISAWIKEKTIDHLRAVVDELSTLSSDASLETVTATLKKVQDSHKLTMPQIGQPLRIALAHKTGGPGVAELIAILGIPESVTRIQLFIKYIQENKKL